VSAGAISGAVLQAARKTARLTQEDLAGMLSADLTTVKGWESGRRPLGNVQARRLAQLRRELRHAGARPGLLAHLHTAIEADAFIGQALAGDCGQLGGEVVTRAWSRLVGWATTGEPLAEAADVVQQRPLLGARDRSALFTAVRDAAERAPGEDGHVLRHQAYYVAADDTSGDGTAWFEHARDTETQRVRLNGQWHPGWSVRRSLAIAEAKLGDREPLGWFIREHLSHDSTIEANLAYWAYWIGCDPDPVAGEEFMARRRVGTEQATRLLHHLTGNLSASLPYAELSAMTIATIAGRWPGLLACDPRLATDLADRTSTMLDTTATGGMRAQLASLHLAARAAAGTTYRKEQA
jgi:hypothetical protein